MFGAFYQGDGRSARRLFAKFDRRSTKIDPSRVPDLALALAVSGPAGQAGPWIALASNHDAELSDAGRARLAVARAMVAFQDGDALEMERALSDYPGPADLPDFELSYVVPSFRARSRLWLGDVKGARELCVQSAGLFDDPREQMVMTGQLAWVACVAGQLEEAEQLASRALTGAESIGLAGHPVLVEALCAQGRVAFERDDFVAAERLFEQSISISEEVRPAFALLSQLLLSRVWLADGRVGDAVDGVAQARAFLRSDSNSPLLGLCDALEGRVATEVGDLDRADECVARLEPGNRALILQTRIDVARGEWDRARKVLAECVPLTTREHLDTAVLAARVAHGSASDDADCVLVAALDVAEVEGFVVAVTDDMVELRPRVALHLRSKRIGKFEQAVLDRLEMSLPGARAIDGSTGPLSDRELMVGRYLASRLTNKEIAAELFVSTNTLKTHVQRIYRKLGVSSRVEAIAEARRLGVLCRLAPSIARAERRGRTERSTLGALPSWPQAG
jgi:LuxR family maltose regulon positive regulatory protein